MEQYIDLSPYGYALDGGIEISFEYTSQDGRVIRGRKRDSGNLSMALEIFACLDLESLPPVNLNIPYKLIVTRVPS